MNDSRGDWRSSPASWRSTLATWLLPKPEIARVDVYHPPRAPGGMHPFRRETPDGVRKLFLRVDEGGAGVLVADATESVRLSPVGCWVVYQLLSGVAADSLRRQLPAGEAGAVVDRAVRAIDELGRPDRRYPAMALLDPLEGDKIHGLDPLQADVVATADAEGLRRTVDWLVRAGIPHVRFLLPERSPREALASAVEYAEDRGLIAGVRLFAREAATGDDLLRWTDFGLDYVVLPVGLTETIHRRAFGEDDLAALERAIRRTSDREIATVAEIGLIEGVFDSLEETVARVVSQGANFVETCAAIGDSDQDGRSSDRLSPTQLPQLAAYVEDLGARGTTPIAFLPPVYSPKSSLDGILRLGPRTAGDLAIRIDASGAVFLPRGPRRPVGTTADAWPDLRRRPEYERFRHLLATLELGEAAVLCGDSVTRPLLRHACWADES